MNEKLNQGLHLVISPGIYHLDEPLVVNHANQIILGLGLATLVSAKQNILISIGNVDGVRVCGLILQAGPSGPGHLLPQHSLSGVGIRQAIQETQTIQALYTMFLPGLEGQTAQLRTL